MALVERLAILIDANASGATREFRKLNDDLKAADANLTKMQKTSAAVGGAFRRFGPAIATGAAVGLGALADRAIDASSALEEAGQKAEVTFGGAFGKVSEFVEDQAEAFNLAKREALEYSSSFGQQLKATGLAADEVAKYSVDLTKLTADFASFNNLSPEEAFTKLSSGLAGETEAVRRYGIDVSAAAVETEAYTSGIAAQGAELTQTQKVQARLNILMKETGDIQGDVARTSDSFANQQRNLNAQLEDTLALIGQDLAPAAADALGGLADLTAGFRNLDDAFRSISGSGGGAEQSIIGFLIDFGKAGGPLSLGKLAADNFAESVLGIGDSTEQTAAMMRGNEGPVNDYGTAAADAAEDTEEMTEAVDYAAEAFDALKEAVDAMRSPILDVREAERQLEEAVDELSTSIEENGKSLDINTEKGRNNQEALDAIADAAFDALGAYQENGASADELAGKTDVMRDRLVDAAMQFGWTRDDANDYADQLGLIPGNVRTDAEFNYGIALGNLNYWRSQVESLNAVADTTVRVAGVNSSGGQVRASGGPVGVGRTYLVGEQGPELVTMPGNGTVTSNAKLSGSSISGGVTINVGTVQAHDYGDFMVQMERRKRLAGLAGH